MLNRYKKPFNFYFTSILTAKVDFFYVAHLMAKAYVSQCCVWDYTQYCNKVSEYSILHLLVNIFLLHVSGFGGCISNIVITMFYPYYINFPLNVIERLEKLENVNLDGCTPFNLPEENCKHDIVGNVYNGTEREFEDTDLQPYSGENDHCSNMFSSGF